MEICYIYLWFKKIKKLISSWITKMILEKYFSGTAGESSGRWEYGNVVGEGRPGCRSGSGPCRQQPKQQDRQSRQQHQQQQQCHHQHQHQQYRQSSVRQQLQPESQIRQQLQQQSYVRQRLQQQERQQQQQQQQEGPSWRSSSASPSGNGGEVYLPVRRGWGRRVARPTSTPPNFAQARALGRPFPRWRSQRVVRRVSQTRSCIFTPPVKNAQSLQNKDDLMSCC